MVRRWICNINQQPTIKKNFFEEICNYIDKSYIGAFPVGLLKTELSFWSRLLIHRSEC